MSERVIEFLFACYSVTQNRTDRYLSPWFQERSTELPETAEYR